jgi:hypothetical protein
MNSHMSAVWLLPQPIASNMFDPAGGDRVNE